jgi:hypothetical protein
MTQRAAVPDHPRGRRNPADLASSLPMHSPACRSRRRHGHAAADGSRCHSTYPAPRSTFQPMAGYAARPHFFSPSLLSRGQPRRPDLRPAFRRSARYRGGPVHRLGDRRNGRLLRHGLPAQSPAPSRATGWTTGAHRGRSSRPRREPSSKSADRRHCAPWPAGALRRQRAIADQGLTRANFQPYWGSRGPTWPRGGSGDSVMVGEQRLGSAG